MYYDFEPVYHNPPSNQWFGYQAWPMERVAEYYFATGNTQAKAILQKRVTCAHASNTALTPTNLEGLSIPSGWTGSYPGLGNTPMTSADNTFLSIRPWYTSVADYPEVQNYLNGGAAPVFSYHRFWAEADIATAFDSFAFLFPNVSPPASATPTVTVTNPGTQTGTVGTAKTLQIAASDTATGKTFTYSATDLPLGLSVSSATGAITGSPTMAGSYTTTVTVNDGSGASSVNFDWTVGATGTGNTVTVTNPGSQTGTVGTAAS